MLKWSGEMKKEASSAQPDGSIQPRQLALCSASGARAKAAVLLSVTTQRHFTAVCVYTQRGESAFWHGHVPGLRPKVCLIRGDTDDPVCVK